MHWTACADSAQLYDFVFADNDGSASLLQSWNVNKGDTQRHRGRMLRVVLMNMLASDALLQRTVCLLSSVCCGAPFTCSHSTIAPCAAWCTARLHCMMQAKAWIRWKQYHIKAHRRKKAEQKGQNALLRMVFPGWRRWAHKLHPVRALAKRLAAQQQHRWVMACIENCCTLLTFLLQSRVHRHLWLQHMLRFALQSVRRLETACFC